MAELCTVKNMCKGGQKILDGSVVLTILLASLWQLGGPMGSQGLNGCTKSHVWQLAFGQADVLTYWAVQLDCSAMSQVTFAKRSALPCGL